MSKIESRDFATYDSIKEQFAKIIHSTKHIASNITLNLVSVSILPESAKWSDMEDFAAKKYGPFKFNFNDANDRTVAGMAFYVFYNCRGSFNSAGQYLSEVTITPQDIFADPGYDLTCNVTAGNPVNYGTKEDPIAGVLLKVQMQVKSYHHLKSNLYSSMENSGGLKVPPKLDEPANEICITVADEPSTVIDSKAANSKAIPSSQHSHGTRSAAASDILQHYGSKANTVERYLNVIVRGDCQVAIVCASGY